MEVIYKDEDLLAVDKQRGKIIKIFSLVTVLYVVFCVAWVIYFSTLPYNDPRQTLPRVLVYVVTAIYVAFAFLFMGIKYHRVNKYHKFLYYVSEGMKYEETNYFVCFAKKDLQKDFVDVISCVFKTWNKKKCEWMEREVYFDVEKEWPDLEQGDRVRYIVQSNFLIEYEVLERGALKDSDQFPPEWNLGKTEEKENEE
jgi:hypothetical protein